MVSSLLPRYFTAEFDLHYKSSVNKFIWIGAGVGILGLAVCYVSVKVIVSRRDSKRRRKKWASVGKDVVVLHQPGRGTDIPCASPQCLQLETFLRITRIPYEVDFDEPFGPKGEAPWVTLNGTETSGCRLSMGSLGRKFRREPSSHLSKEELAIARAFQTMVEDHFYWVEALWRTPWNVREASKGQGIGRHSESEVIEMGLKDLKALSAYLGETKPFLTGPKPTELDCAAFGSLAFVLWSSSSPSSPLQKLLESDCSNLRHLCERMKETYWPDWDRFLVV